MSVPPPSCTPNSTSTGSCEQRREIGDRRCRRRRARCAAPAAGRARRRTARRTRRCRPSSPLWSTAMITSRARLRPAAAVADEPLGHDGAVLGQPVRRLAWMVRVQSMSAGRGRRVRLARASAPSTAARVRSASWSLELGRARWRSTWRAVARVSSGSSRLSSTQQRRRGGRRARPSSSSSGSSSSWREVEPLDRIALQHLHHRRREVAADVAEPAGDRRAPSGRARRLRPRAAAPATACASGASYTAPRATSMRASSPSSATPVPSASPPPSTSRQRRSRSASDTRRSRVIGAPRDRRTGRPSSSRTVRSRGRGAPDRRRGRRRRGRLAAVAPPARSTPSWRRSAGSNAPNVRRSSGNGVGEHVAASATRSTRSTTSSSSASCTQHGAAAGEEPLDEARPRRRPACRP